MEENELKALVSLLDDDDKHIVSHVEEKILSIGTSVIPFLEKEWESNFNPSVQQRIEDLIHTLQYELLKARLKEWYLGEDHDLLTGMWILATYQYPDLELEKLKQELEQIYYETWLEFRPDLYAFDQNDHRLKSVPLKTSSGTSENSTASSDSPLISSRLRKTPSRRAQAFSATR